ncbi:MAG: PAS domain S-box protein [Chloroflexales bacterium]
MTPDQPTYEQLVRENQKLRVRLDEAECALAASGRAPLATEGAPSAGTLSTRQVYEILDGIAAGVLLMDFDGRYLFANQRAANMFGLTPTEVIGRSIFDVLPFEVAQRYLERNRRFIASRSFMEYEDTFELPVGRHTFFIIDQVLTDNYGEGYALLTSSIDITARKHAEHTIRRLAERLELATRAAHMGVWDWDIQKNKLLWDDRMYEIFGMRREDFAGAYESWLNGIHPDDRAASAAISAQAQRGECAYDTEFRVIWPDGSIHVIKADGDVIRDADGTPIRMIGVNYDITARKRAEADLQVALAKYQTLFVSFPLGITVSDEMGQIIETNATAEHLLGLGRAEQHQRQIDSAEWQVVRPDGSPMPSDEYASVRALKEQRIVDNVEMGMITPTGATTWINVTAAPLPLDPQIVVITYSDITARKYVEKALHESQQNLVSLIENTDSNIWSVDTQYRLIVGNRWYHHNVSAVIGRSMTVGECVLVPELPQAAIDEWRAYYDRAMQHGPFSVEINSRFTQEPQTVEYRLSPIMTVTGQVAGVAILGRDITARKQAEAALKSSEARYRSLFDHMAEGYAYCQMIVEDGVAQDWIYCEVNAAFEALTGLHHVRGKRVSEVIPGIREADPGLFEIYARVALTGQHEKFEMFVESLQRWFALSVYSPAEGFFVAVFDVITARKQAEAAMHQMMEELSRSNADLEQFASVASHDLQEPLRAVTGMVQLLQQRYQGQLDARADEYIGLAVDAAARMQALINDLLVFSRVQRRGKPFVPIAVDTVLDHALANLYVAITENAAVITHDPMPTVQADPTQLTQIFQNLIGNAIKFHREVPPQIHISAARRDGAWCFSVHDNGIGISPDYFERIFVIFQRLHPRRDYPGTGIGLALCKKIVERHGGQIWVDSHMGQGTTFFFTLPDRS